MSGQLAGRLALVTGAGSGIGRAVCQIFAREGARIAAVDVNQSGTQETVSLLQGDHQAFTADVSSSSAVASLLSDVRAAFPGDAPSIAVNCAGITRDGLFVKMSEDKYDQVLNVNLKIGNIGQVNYSASKSGVVGLTKSIAKEWGAMGIRCNAVVPGFIDTPMIETIPEKIMSQVLQLVPLARPGKPEEIAETCLFLASDRSSYITGETIDVTGGLGM